VSKDASQKMNWSAAQILGTLPNLLVCFSSSLELAMVRGKESDKLLEIIV
jgi:hypothetical protein